MPKSLPDAARIHWRKSRRSHQEGACVEIADLNGLVGVRDSKDPYGPILNLDRPTAAALAKAIRAGDFDL